MANVEVLIEDEPSPEILRSAGLSPRHDTLFGLYNGVPLPHRGAWFGNHPPDTITIYYRPLVRAWHSPERIRIEVKRTVIHEIAHLLGMTDQEIRRLGY